MRQVLFQKFLKISKILGTIEIRLKTLNENNFSTAIATENPLISTLIEDFLEFQANNKIPRQTVRPSKAQLTKSERTSEFLKHVPRRRMRQAPL